MYACPELKLMIPLRWPIFFFILLSRCKQIRATFTYIDATNKANKNSKINLMYRLSIEIVVVLSIKTLNIRPEQIVWIESSRLFSSSFQGNLSAGEQFH